MVLLSVSTDIVVAAAGAGAVLCIFSLLSVNMTTTESPKFYPFALEQPTTVSFLEEEREREARS